MALTLLGIFECVGDYNLPSKPSNDPICVARKIIAKAPSPVYSGSDKGYASLSFLKHGKKPHSPSKLV